MTALIEAVRQSRAIAAAPAFAEWSSGEHFPGPNVDTDEEIATNICQNVSTWFHPAGSCTMGITPDCVVTPDLRVNGTSGLRVADASVMPTVVTVNTNASSMMIGWRAGDLVLFRWANSRSNEWEMSEPDSQTLRLKPGGLDEYMRLT